MNYKTQKTINIEDFEMLKIKNAFTFALWGESWEFQSLISEAERRDGERGNYLSDVFISYATVLWIF